MGAERVLRVDLVYKQTAQEIVRQRLAMAQALKSTIHVARVCQIHETCDAAALPAHLVEHASSHVMVSINDVAVLVGRRLPISHARDLPGAPLFVVSVIALLALSSAVNGSLAAAHNVLL